MTMLFWLFSIDRGVMYHNKTTEELLSGLIRNNFDGDYKMALAAFWDITEFDWRWTH